MGQQIKSNRLTLDLSPGLVVPAAAGVVNIPLTAVAYMWADVIANYSDTDNPATFAAWDTLFFKRFRLWSPWVAIGAVLDVDRPGTASGAPGSADLSQVYFYRSGNDDGGNVRANVGTLGEWVDVGESLTTTASEGNATTMEARLAEAARLYFPTPPAGAVGRPVGLALQVEVAHTLRVGGWA